MVSRTFCIPGIFFLLAATGLLIVTSISLPYLPALDIVRVHINSGTVAVRSASTNSSQSISQLRFGIWAYCADQLPTGNRDCSTSGHGYSVSLSSTDTVVVGSTWTRGLAVIPVAAVVSFLAFLLSFSTHITVTLVSSLMSFLAALLTFIAFMIEIALFVRVHHEAGNLSGVSENTNTAPGFWLTFASLLLLLFAGCTVCFGRRRERMSSATHAGTARPTGPFWSRWRKNKY